MVIQTWSDVQLIINIRRLPFSILRFNVSGRMIDTATGQTLASTVQEATELLEQETHG